MVTSITSYNFAQKPHMKSFLPGSKNISYGHINMKKSEEVKQHGKDITLRDKLLAGTGAVIGVSIPLLTFMKKQKAPNIFKVEYKVQHMITMAACGNIGGIMMSSIGEPKHDIIKKWKEGAFQMVLTSAPLLLVDGSIALCTKSKHRLINNNFTKIICSVLGVTIGSNSAIALFNKLRNDKEAKKPKRELKLKDMIANLDDAVAILVLAKIPFADKIHIERALPFIYSICGYRSGTGDRKTK